MHTYEHTLQKSIAKRYPLNKQTSCKTISNSDSARAMAPWTIPGMVAVPWIVPGMVAQARVSRSADNNCRYLLLTAW